MFKNDGVEVLIVTFNSVKHILPCLESVRANGANPIVVDNNSVDQTQRIVRNLAVKLICIGENLGYGKSLNLGFRETEGEFVVLSNPDIVYPPESINAAVEYLKSHPDVGILGVQQTFPDGSWQRSYGDLPGVLSALKEVIGYDGVRHWSRRMLWPRRLDRRPKEVPYVDGGVLIVRRSAFEEVGGFDEVFFFYSEEADLCHRIRRAGWKVIFLPSVTVVHARGGSVNGERSDKFLRYLVTSRMLLAQRCTARWQARAYARLEQLYFWELSIIYRMIQAFRTDGQDISISDKIRMFDCYVNIWQEYLTTGAVRNSYR